MAMGASLLQMDFKVSTELMLMLADMLLLEKTMGKMEVRLNYFP